MSKLTAKQQYWSEQLQQADAFDGSLAQYAQTQNISVQTRSESVLKVAEQIKPLMDHATQPLIRSPLIFMDETRVQVLKEPNKTAQGHSHMWVQRAGPPDQPVVQFHDDPGRSTDTAKRLLAGFAGTPMTDGYKPIEKWPKTTT